MSVKDNILAQQNIYPVLPEEFPRVVAVWEASVRATHLLLTEVDIQLFKPLVGDGLHQMKELISVRDRKQPTTSSTTQELISRHPNPIPNIAEAKEWCQNFTLFYKWPFSISFKWVLGGYFGSTCNT